MLIFYGIFLLLMVVLTWTWVLVVGLLGVRSLTFIFPKVTLLSFGTETSGLLTDVSSLRVGSLVLVASLLDGQNVFISSRRWGIRQESIVVEVGFSLSMGNVWHFRSENLILTGLIVRFLIDYHNIMSSRTWKSFLSFTRVKCLSGSL